MHSYNNYVSLKKIKLIPLYMCRKPFSINTRMKFNSKQVQGYRYKKGKDAFLTASITVEAAIAIPLFLILIFITSYLLFVINNWSRLQTPHGLAYHTDINCTYIKKNPVLVSINDLGTLRNASGGKYYPCEICCKYLSNIVGGVYITVYGDRYHVDKKCSAISKDVKEVDISQVGNRRKCSKCKGY